MLHGKLSLVSLVMGVCVPHLVLHAEEPTAPPSTPQPVSKTAPDPADTSSLALYQLALTQMDQGDYAAAEATLSGLLATNPPEPWQTLARDRLTVAQEAQGSRMDRHVDEVKDRLDAQSELPWYKRGRTFVADRRTHHPTVLGAQGGPIDFVNLELPTRGSLWDRTLSGWGANAVARHWLMPWLAVGGDLLVAQTTEAYRGIYALYNTGGVHAQVFAALPLRLTPFLGINAGYELHRGEWIDLGGDYCTSLYLGWKQARPQEDPDYCSASVREVTGADTNQALLVGPLGGLLWTFDALEISFALTGNFPWYNYSRTYTINEQVEGEDLSATYEVPDGWVRSSRELYAAFGLAYAF